MNVHYNTTTLHHIHLCKVQTITLRYRHVFIDFIGTASCVYYTIIHIRFFHGHHWREHGQRMSGHHPQLVDSHGFLISFPSTKFWASAASASPDHDCCSHWNMSLPPCHSQHSCRSPGAFWDSHWRGDDFTIKYGYLEGFHFTSYRYIRNGDLWFEKTGKCYVCIFRYIDID